MEHKSGYLTAEDGHDTEAEPWAYTEYEVRLDETGRQVSFSDLLLASDDDFPEVSRLAIHRFIESIRADYQEQRSLLNLPTAGEARERLRRERLGSWESVL